ncbi:MAG: polyprenyl synthetase family protein [Gemmatimonadota bacterium]|jgi:geranylgeranyl pyrophosphate synthase
MSTVGGGVDLEAFLVREKERVEASLTEALSSLLAKVPGAYAPAIQHGVLSGGKRLRPILCVAAYRAAGGKDDGVYALAVSLELIHAYSLMHDDLPCMDDAELRRGEPTTHKIHGEGPTMVAGALLIPLAAFQAWKAAHGMGLDDKGGRALVSELSRAAGGGGMVGGQVLDLLGEGRTLSVPELDDLHRRKTGALLRASLRMGGIAAGASDRALDAFDEYGRAIGLAFQIADDLLDATSDAQALGKNPSDAELGKSTYVTLFGVEEASRRAHELAEEAVTALRGGGIGAPELEALSRYIVDRTR